MTTFDVFICDEDKNLAVSLRKQISGLVQDGMYLINIITLTAPQLAIYEFDKQCHNIIFMDLLYTNSDSSGIELAENIRKRDSYMFIVFITEHLELIPYLLRGNIIPAAVIKKPVKSVDVADIFENITSLCLEQFTDELFSFNFGTETVRLPYSQIVYFESLNKKIYLHTPSKRYGYYFSLTALEPTLHGTFIRCHNSFIINKDHIKNVDYTAMTVTLTGGVQVPISRKGKQAMKEALEAGRQ
jgi:two-component system response regulator AgrA